ncbi:MAG: hypothetical protein HUU54_06980 [Ignavibacteriaceae bacterium]|nr:hypothetical protein [Ignavibacteriaceae bacterium]
MQTLLFTRTISEIVKRLKVAELIELISPLINPETAVEVTPEQRVNLAELIFQSREGYSALSNSNECKAILESLGVKDIYQSANLAGMLTVINTAENSEGILSNPKNYALFQAFYSNLSVLMAFSNTVELHLQKQKYANFSEVERVIELEVFDFDGNGVQLPRLAVVIDSLQKLHSYICKVIDEKQSRLNITYLDSGSDLLIGLHCNMKVSELMKTLVLQFWQKIKYKQYDEFEKAHDHLIRGLNITQHIIRQEKNGFFDADQAQKQKHLIIDEMIKLTSLGVTLKDVDADHHLDRKKLMLDKREIK